MTIVNHTFGTHSGMLVTGTGDDLEIDLEIVGGRTLRMSAAGDELGAWPVDECRIEPDPELTESYRLVVGGEDARFTPSDAAGFGALVDHVMGVSSVDSQPVAPHDESEPLGVSAVEDPVAFLFGSAPPPTPATSGLPEFDTESWSDESSDVAEWESQFEGDDQLDEVYDFGDDEEVLEVEDVVEFEEVERVTASAVEDVATEMPAVVEPVEGVAVRVESEEESELASLATPEPLDPAEPELDVDADAEPSKRVVGGSAMERLSAAIVSLRSSERDSVADGEGEDGEYHLGPNTVASDVLDTQRSLREHQLKEMAKGKWLRWGGMTVAIAAVIGIFAFLTPRAIDFLQNYESDIGPPPEVTETTSPPPTTASDANPPVETEDTTPEALPIGADAGTVFDRPSPEFISGWDAAGRPIDSVLTFDSFPPLGTFQEQFTPYLALNGEVGPDGTLDRFALVIDPTGPAEYDRIAIQALGVAIATVDPDRSPDGRAALLGQLGLNVRQPSLGGIDGSTESAGIAYTLVYDAAANLLTMTVSPAG